MRWTKLIYLASPYSAKKRSTIHKRFDAAVRACLHLWEQGYLVYGPIFYTHPISACLPHVPRDAWMELDLRLLEKCDELWVLCIPGWKKSVGVRTEIHWAKKFGKPVRYLKLDQLPECGWDDLVQAVRKWVNGPIPESQKDCLY